MDENYLYSLPKADVESFINTLEEGRNNPNNSYVATYMNTKGSSVQEVVDARTRLAAIENKEAIDSLTSRVATMESLVNAPEYREVGKTFVHDGMLLGFKGVICHGNGITAYLSDYLAYSTDGKTFKYYLDPGDGTPEGMTCVGFDYTYHLFRNGQILFTDGLFFIYSSREYMLMSSPDLKTFTKIEGFEDNDLYDAIMLPDGDTVKIITYDNKVYQLSSNGATLLGTMNIELDTSYLDVPEVLTKFNNKYWGIDSDSLYCSDDMLTYTEVPITINNKSFSGIKRFYVLKATNDNEQDILVASSKSNVAFTIDGENWEGVSLPTMQDNRSIYCSTPIDIKKISSDSASFYFAIIQTGVTYNSGIYRWSNLNESPICIYQPKEDDSNAIKLGLFDNALKVVNNNIYFLDKSEYKYDIVELKYNNISKITPTTIPELENYPNQISKPLGYNAIRGNKAPPSIICMVNDCLYITSGQSSNAYKQIPVYAPA